MDESLLREIFDELFQTMEAAETQSGALLSFLKAKKVVKEKELAPYLEQASTTASVRWVAARARLNRLLEAAMKPEEEEEKKQDPGKGKAEISRKKRSGAGEKQEKSQSQTTSQEKDAESPDGEALVAAMRNPAGEREESTEPEKAEAKSGTPEARKQKEWEGNSEGKDSEQRDSSAKPNSGTQPNPSATEDHSAKRDSGTKSNPKENDGSSSQRNPA